MKYNSKSYKKVYIGQRKQGIPLLKPSMIYLSKNPCDIFLICWFRRRVLCKWKYVPALPQSPNKSHREGIWASLQFFSLTLIKYKTAVSFLLKPGSRPSVL